ncbi:MAG TPA: glycoside hydrolase family 3 N-terminal domain-containing protein [Ignavibacteria bacterium]
MVVKDKPLMVLLSILAVVIIAFFLVLVFKVNFRCGKQTDKEQQKDSIDKKKDTIKTIGAFSLDDFFKENKQIKSLVNSIYENLNDTEKVGQMIVTSGGKLGLSDEHIINLIKEKKVGGICLLKGSKKELTDLIDKFKSEAESCKTLPLIFSCDGEPTLFNEKIQGSPEVKDAIKINNPAEADKIAGIICDFIKEIGFTQNYAPVCDFCTNKEIIGDRAFGNKQDRVTELAISFIKKTQSLGIVATAKHFPGHGSASGDSHKNLVVIKGKLKELDVFKNVIKSGVISIMVGHIAIKGGEYDTNGEPATISKIIVTTLLKDSLHFKGIIVTDAMNMKGVSGFQTPALKAILAGCDMILMPSDETKLITSVVEKMKDDNVLKSQIEQSVKKIIKLKICLNLFTKIK